MYQRRFKERNSVRSNPKAHRDRVHESSETFDLRLVVMRLSVRSGQRKPSAVELHLVLFLEHTPSR